LKPAELWRTPSALRVAPRRGAWIETVLVLHAEIYGVVAPRRGAWIETLHAVLRA